MIEIRGELWDYLNKPNTVVCITTNGSIRKDGACVMGRGCALEATQRIPGIAFELGKHLLKNGNIGLRFNFTQGAIRTFPVKHRWFERANLDLIANEAYRLRRDAASLGEIFILPRPGCGNGQLLWETVRPVLSMLPDNVWIITK